MSSNFPSLPVSAGAPQLLSVDFAPAVYRRFASAEPDVTLAGPGSTFDAPAWHKPRGGSAFLFNHTRLSAIKAPSARATAHTYRPVPSLVRGDAGRLREFSLRSLFVPLRLDLLFADDAVPNRKAWRIGILSSHAGTNFRAIAEAIERGQLNASIAVVICNNLGAATFDIAAQREIPAYLINGNTHPGHPDRDSAIQACLANHGVDVVVLAGYNKRLADVTVEAFPRRVLNIHPGPLSAESPPGKYGGLGMYGDYVHAAILADGLAKTATTVHVADGQYDHGSRILASSVCVRRGDTVCSLGERVYDAGRQIYWRAIRMHLRRLEQEEAAQAGTASAPMRQAVAVGP